MTHLTLHHMFRRILPATAAAAAALAPGAGPAAAAKPIRAAFRAALLSVVALLAAPPPAPAHPVGHLESYRVLTYNVAGIDIPVVDDEYAPEVSASDRADQMSDHILQGDYDIVALQEVFDNPGGPHMRDDFLDNLSPSYPHHVDMFEGDAATDELDSGLMLFSRLPFVPVATSDPEDECVQQQGGDCLIAFHEFDASGAEDTYAAKGVGFVRVENPRTGGQTNVFFTHMQASGTELPVAGCGDIVPDGCTIEIRKQQVAEELAFIERWSSRWDTTRDTILTGDLNIRHQNEDGTDRPEYVDRMADYATIGLHDTWTETSPQDPVSSRPGSVNNKLDYVLHRPPYAKGAAFGFCTQQLTVERQFTYHEQTDDGPVSITASDHHPVAALIAHDAPACSPAKATLNPPDGTATMTFEHPGSYRWLHFQEGGTYGFSAEAAVRMELTAYPEDDLSTPMAPFIGSGVIPGGTEKAESVVWAPDHGFYLRVRVRDGANPYWTGDVKLKINRHDGTKPSEAIQLDPFRWYAAKQMSAGVQNPVSDAWFYVKTDTLDSGQQQRLHFLTAEHRGVSLRSVLYDKAQFDGGQQVGLIGGLWGIGWSDLATPLPNDPNQFSPVPAQGSLYYLRVQKNAASPPGTFQVRWTTNLFYAQLLSLNVLDDEDDTGDDEPEPIVTIDGATGVYPLGEMSEDGPPHDFPSNLQMIKAAETVGLHVYENDVDDAGGCLQAPTECDDMGYASISPFNPTDPDDPAFKLQHVGIDLDPADHEFFPWFTNPDDGDDGDYRVKYRAFWRIDQGG